MSNDQGIGAAGGGATEYPGNRLSVALLVCSALVVVMQLYAAIPLVAPLSAQLLGDATFAVSTAFSLCYALGFLIWGPLADQFGRRRIMLIGLIALTVVTVCCSFATSMTAIGLLRAAQGFLAASFAPVALAYLSESMAPARRAPAIGAMATAFLVAGISGQVIPEFLALHFGWQSVFYVSTALIALAAVGVWALRREPSRAPDGLGLRGRMRNLRVVATRPTVLLLAVAHMTLLLSLVAMYSALGPHLTAFGLDASHIMLVRLLGLPGMFASLLTGLLVRRFGRPGAARFGFAVAALGLVLEAALSWSLVGVALASLVFVTGVALALPAMIALFGESAAPNHASGMALNGFFLFLGASIGPLTIGLGLNFPALLIALAGLLLVAVASLTLCVRVGRRGTQGAN
ncbi:MFS transporter [Leucobacter albus]|uniref:MFS transporter n=1 Tax=Leucobacter albus TaxID=272210 RepID=A0ABW3TKI1_9MICO